MTQRKTKSTANTTTSTESLNGVRLVPFSSILDTKAINRFVNFSFENKFETRSFPLFPSCFESSWFFKNLQIASPNLNMKKLVKWNNHAVWTNILRQILWIKQQIENWVELCGTKSCKHFRCVIKKSWIVQLKTFQTVNWTEQPN